jgi:hypothetical protein
VKLDIRPEELKIGNVTYPQGFYITAAMTLFGQQADTRMYIQDISGGSISNCDTGIDQHRIPVKGPFRDFESGDLQVEDAHGSVIDCDIGPLNQPVYMGGKSDHESPISIESNAPKHPNLRFQTYVSMRFCHRERLKACPFCLVTCSSPNIPNTNFAVIMWDPLQS